jgi:hypothetical protein
LIDEKRLPECHFSITVLYSSNDVSPPLSSLFGSVWLLRSGRLRGEGDARNNGAHVAHVLHEPGINELFNAVDWIFILFCDLKTKGPQGAVPVAGSCPTVFFMKSTAGFFVSQHASHYGPCPCTCVFIMR